MDRSTLGERASHGQIYLMREHATGQIYQMRQQQWADLPDGRARQINHMRERERESQP